MSLVIPPLVCIYIYYIYIYITLLIKSAQCTSYYITFPQITEFTIKLA